MAEQVVILTEPIQWMSRMSRQQFGDNPNSVNIRCHACQRYRSPLATIETIGIGNQPPGQKVGDRTQSPSSTSTSLLSILMGYTFTLAAGLCTALPVLGSYCQPCQGHTSLPPSITPCPSGPPRWMQTLSIAEIVPPTFATQITFSPTVN